MNVPSELELVIQEQQIKIKQEKHAVNLDYRELVTNACIQSINIISTTNYDTDKIRSNGIELKVFCTDQKSFSVSVAIAESSDINYFFFYSSSVGSRIMFLTEKDRDLLNMVFSKVEDYIGELLPNILYDIASR